MQALLLLEDGSEFVGQQFGAEGEALGEVVFNTSMTGYQEILTDPSYCGQIVTMTSPQIGNYGINEEDFESKQLYLSGFVVREYSRHYSNWRGLSSLDSFLKSQGVIGISGIDTRALTRRLRDGGAMRGIIATGDCDVEELLAKVRGSRTMEGSDYVRDVVDQEHWVWRDRRQEERSQLDILALDTGIKHGILRAMDQRGASLRIASASALADEIDREQPDGLILSNGPGDPAVLQPIIELVKSVQGKFPILGICLGHQLLGLSLGAKTYKMKFGHHGGNHPVKNLLTSAVEITAQNHGFAVDADSLPEELQLTHISLFDGTVEGFRHRELPIQCVQYHPESAPGPHDSRYIFDDFIEKVQLASQEREGA